MLSVMKNARFTKNSDVTLIINGKMEGDFFKAGEGIVQIDNAKVQGDQTILICNGGKRTYIVPTSHFEFV